MEWYLKDLTTQHPGGWQDIIDYVNAHYDRYKATYKEIAADVTVTPIYKMDGEAHKAQREYSAREIVSVMPRLEEIHHSISGIAAQMGWVVLKTLKLPIPGHKDWIKPCSKWRTDEESK